VAHFSQRFIRSVIRLVWNQAQDGASTFLDALNVCQSGQWEKTGTGWTVQSSSGAGYSTTFHIPTSDSDPSNITPQSLQELFEQILEYYQKLIDIGVAEDAGGDATQSNFVKQLWRYFPTVKGWTNNFTYLAP
jgi:hypothetical protein